MTAAGKPAAPKEEPKGAEKKKAEKMEAESHRKPLQHDEPTSDEWATGKLGRPAGALDVKDWSETFYTAPK